MKGQVVFCSSEAEGEEIALTEDMLDWRIARVSNGRLYFYDDHIIPALLRGFSELDGFKLAISKIYLNLEERWIGVPSNLLVRVVLLATEKVVFEQRVHLLQDLANPSLRGWSEPAAWTARFKEIIKNSTEAERSAIYEERERLNQRTGVLNTTLLALERLG